MKQYKKKTTAIPVLNKVRPLGNLTDVYYTYSNWNNKNIDGVEYIAVAKGNPEDNTMKTKSIYWMRKDNMEYIK